MARSAYIYIWVDPDGNIKGAYTVKYEALMVHTPGWKLLRVYNGINDPVVIAENQ